MGPDTYHYKPVTVLRSHFIILAKPTGSPSDINRVVAKSNLSMHNLTLLSVPTGNCFSNNRKVSI
jgi:hypothetical protein